MICSGHLLTHHHPWLQIAGAVFFSYWLIYRPSKLLLSWLIHKIRGPWVSSRILTPTGQNDYAIITGATDGIGLEYARQLASRGFNLLLLSRTESKLQRVATELQQQYPQCKKVDILAVNFGQTDIYPKIQTKIESLDARIHVLVNNVGTHSPTMEYFTDYPVGYNANLINTNILSFTSMTELVLPVMKKQPLIGRNPARGVIINISSSAAVTQLPLFSTYGASKAYMNYLSGVLAAENAEHQIIIQTVTPNQVETNLTRGGHLQKSLAVLAPDFVHHALRTVGVEPRTSAHPKHKILNGVMELLDGWMWEPLFLRLKWTRVKRMREEALKNH